jgi:hypothetical protein
MVRFTLFDRRKKEEGRRKKEEGRRKNVAAIIELFRYVVETRQCRVSTGILNVQLLDIFL